MGVYLLNDKFVNGSVMRGKAMLEDNSFLAINKVKNNQYTKSRILSSIEFF
jgi:hypothetical protein